MKTIILLAATVVAGAVRYPSEGPLVVRDDKEADLLVETGAAEFLDEEADGDDLDDLTVDKLKAVAADEKVDLGDATKKADVLAKIRAHRAAA